MKKDQIFGFAVLLILQSYLIISCGQKSDNSYFPLRESSEYKYLSNFGEFTAEVRGQRLIDKFETTQIAYLFPDETKFFYYVKTDSGVFNIAEESQKTASLKVYEVPKTIFKLPLEVGKLWRYKDEISGNEFDISAEIASVNDTVSVRAGTYYNCLRIDYSAQKQKNFGVLFGSGTLKLKGSNWYAQGIGRIKVTRKTSSNHMMFGTGDKFDMELVEFIKK